MLDALSMYSDELAEAYLEGKETVEQIRKAIRIGTLSLELTPFSVDRVIKTKAFNSCSMVS
jgi:elongation factor G